MSKTKIEIIRLPKGIFYSGHVMLVATSLDKNDFIYADKNGKKTKARKILLDYSLYNSRPIRPLDADCFASVNDAENRIVFESNVSFRDFCSDLLSSKYNSSENYNSLSNNCVHSIIFALNAANIHLSFENNSSLKHLVCCFWMYTKIITPHGLMDRLKAHKERETVNERFYIAPLARVKNL